MVSLSMGPPTLVGLYHSCWFGKAIVIHVNWVGIGFGLFLWPLKGLGRAWLGQLGA